MILFKDFFKVEFLEQSGRHAGKKNISFIHLKNIVGLVTESAKDRLEIKTFMIIGHDLFES